MEVLICRDCGNQFEHWDGRPGFKNQCSDCFGHKLTKEQIIERAWQQVKEREAGLPEGSLTGIRMNKKRGIPELVIFREGKDKWITE
jgi:hypothetical protein